jgi:hypothetical protein
LVSAIDFGTQNVSIRFLLYWLNDLDDERKLVTSFSLLPKIFVNELLFSRRTLIFSFCFSLELNFGVSLYFLHAAYLMLSLKLLSIIDLSTLNTCSALLLEFWLVDGYVLGNFSKKLVHTSYNSVVPSEADLIIVLEIID